MKLELYIPDYSPEQGLTFDWEEDFSIEVQHAEGTVLIRANRSGLISLARHMLLLAQPEVPVGRHFHLDESNSLEDGSVELIIEKA
ncbi:MAG: hypothetical protein MUD01_20945 [Chloroflexaceae bacterium]|jgi:hypothetical protein|nr:hypothetical protein [Chloroflexaceae bacterium]